SEALLAPAESDQHSGLSGQLGGLASLAGVSLGGAKTDKTGTAIEILKSREFFSKFAEKHNILPDLIAAKGWELASNRVVYNDEIYNEQSGKWIRDVKPPKRSKPSMQEAKPLFDSAVNIYKSSDTGMVTISVTHYSPYTAKDWVDWLIQDINLVMKKRDKEDAENSISYLQSEVNKTNIVEQKTLLYQLIEEQAKTLMFTEVRSEYVFKTIDPAIVSETKFKPKRFLIVLICIILSGMFSIVLLLIHYFLRTDKLSLK
ncbi:MAG: LPS O-antigen length regulator, partial [Paraglaciecola sp.]|nr:LPS O-antigen length regulator [Paraglaciecola sp.]